MAEGSREMTGTSGSRAKLQLALVIEDTEDDGVSFKVTRNLPHVSGPFTGAEVLMTQVVGYLDGLAAAQARIGDKYNVSVDPPPDNVVSLFPTIKES